jgi:hypothetical protein
MTETAARRRGHGEDAIYFDATKNRYVGAVSLGFGPDEKRNRRKVTGRTKQSANCPELFPSPEVREVEARGAAPCEDPGPSTAVHVARRDD